MPKNSAASLATADPRTIDPIVKAERGLSELTARRLEIEEQRRAIVDRHTAARAAGRAARMGNDPEAAAAAGEEARGCELALEQIDDGLVELSEVAADAERGLDEVRDRALRDRNAALVNTAIGSIEAVVGEISAHLQMISVLQDKLLGSLPVFAFGIDQHDKMLSRRDTAAEIVRRAIARPDRDASPGAQFLLLRRLRLAVAQIADGSGSPDLPDPAEGKIFDPFPVRRQVVASQSFCWTDIYGRPETLTKGSTRTLPEPLVQAAIAAGVATETRPHSSAFSETGPTGFDWAAEAAAEKATKKAEFDKVFPGPWTGPEQVVDVGVDLRTEVERSLRRQREAFAAQVAA